MRLECNNSHVQIDTMKKMNLSTFSVSQQNAMAQTSRERYWCQALRDGNIPVLELPTDRPRPKDISLACAVVET